jgi:bifunctional non-homologous end joining protein LigD
VTKSGSDRLHVYRAKRDFRSTHEPSGREPPASTGDAQPVGRRFVVQRHRASRLHYDFRMEVGDALVSWAVPRGPTLAPGIRRLAVRVEDHPLGYFDFEGVIGDGQYGAGDVIVWDWGTYRPDPATADPAKAIDSGEFKFWLDGVKLAGSFVLVRTNGLGRTRRTEGDLRSKWLLIHRRDDAAIEGWDPEEFPRSVRTGRVNDELARSRRASAAT